MSRSPGLFASPFDKPAGNGVHGVAKDGLGLLERILARPGGTE